MIPNKAVRGLEEDWGVCFGQRQELRITKRDRLYRALVAVLSGVGLVNVIDHGCVWIFGAVERFKREKWCRVWREVRWPAIARICNACGASKIRLSAFGFGTNMLTESDKMVKQWKWPILNQLVDIEVRCAALKAFLLKQNRFLTAPQCGYKSVVIF